MRVTQIDYLHETGAKKNQEDYLLPLPGTASPQDRIFIVCDGVGGAENGEIASKFVAEGVAAGLRNARYAEVGTPLVNRLLEESRAKLVEHALLKGLSKDMATTFTLLMLMGDKAFIAWCGDSRVYHLRGNEILFRTTDHSLVNSLVRNGELTEEDARDHPQKNLLLKAIRADEPGTEAEGHWVREIREGDYFLLCTDGLLENISDSDILFLLQQSEHREEMYLAKAFRTYCHNKTRDNYSMYLLRVNPTPQIEENTASTYKSQPKVAWLLFLLVILTVAAAFVIRENYFGARVGAARGAASQGAASRGAALQKEDMKLANPGNIRRDSMDIPTVIPTAASGKDTLTQ
jgi:serine/threonine protein phosphatase PrpC